jgi:hypothetical protein
LHLLSVLQDLLFSAIQDVGRRHVTECLVITAVVVVVDEIGNCPLKLSREFIRDLVHFPLDALVIALQLPVSLGMVGCRQDMADTNEVQIVPEGPGDVARPVIREQLLSISEMGHFLNRTLWHNGGKK